MQWERDHQRCADELAATKRSLETAQTESSTLARQLKVTYPSFFHFHILYTLSTPPCTHLTTSTSTY